MNSPQLRRFWAMLGDVSRQVQWPIDGEHTWLDKEEWRLLFCAAYRQHLSFADGINGGKVMLGLRLRDIFAGLEGDALRQRAADLITLVQAFGDQHEVKWTDPKESALREQYERDRVIP